MAKMKDFKYEQIATNRNHPINIVQHTNEV